MPPPIFDIPLTYDANEQWPLNCEITHQQPQMALFVRTVLQVVLLQLVVAEFNSAQKAQSCTEKYGVPNENCNSFSLNVS